MNVVAIIPARGGSKGIPRKNLQVVAGKSLVAWNIEAAHGSTHVNRVVVSTDDLEIAAVARACAAEVVNRPDEISGDLDSSESALLHVLDVLRTDEGYQPDLVVFLQCTSPLTAPEDIDGVVEALLKEEADTAFAASEFHYFLWQQSSDGEAVELNHEKHIRLMRQQKKSEFVEAGAVYVMKADGFVAARHRFFGKTTFYEMPASRRWEIDEPVDLLVADVLMREELKNRKVRLFPEQLEAVVMDFDGVFTDNRVIVFEDGREAVVCSRSDGWGLSELVSLGLPSVVISTEKNPVVAARCEKLKLEFLHGVDDKVSVLREWAAEKTVTLSNVVFVGNDVNDAGCLQAVGCPVIVADAHPAVKSLARIVLESKGGEGALRELTELIKLKTRSI